LPPATDPVPPAPASAVPDVRLVVADMDGTLLDADGRVPETFWPVLAELRARGIAFSPASGRQSATLQRLFAGASHGMVVIAENGAFVAQDGQEVSSRALRRTVVLDVVRAVRELAAGGADLGVVVCGKRSAYVERTDDAFLSEARKYYAALEVLSDATAGDDEILKLAVFHFADVRVAADALRAVVDDEQVVVSGAHWVDVMRAGVDKGAALRDLQDRLGISRAQTVVFGDYLNDLELLGAADHSYAMANAHPDVLRVARHVAPANTEDGVVRTLRDLLGLGPGTA
jgi:Cof subfamily protein (haloacid dehalogenase superfamily)